eukprot:6011515-Amphidinium_carterae.1
MDIDQMVAKSNETWGQTLIYSPSTRFVISLRQKFVPTVTQVKFGFLPCCNVCEQTCLSKAEGSRMSQATEPASEMTDPGASLHLRNSEHLEFHVKLKWTTRMAPDLTCLRGSCLVPKFDGIPCPLVCALWRLQLLPADTKCPNAFANTDRLHTDTGVAVVVLDLGLSFVKGVLFCTVKFLH